MIAGVSLLTIVCAAVIAFVIVGNADSEAHEIKSARGTVTLTKAEARGREVFGENCANCHTLASANAVGQIGPNLDELKPDAALVRHAVEFGRSNGRGEMPGRLLSGVELEEVAAYVAAAGGHGAS
ncbi:c-type cytochrome [Conexibacter arvalis]|uniref:Mono/diheme cytochrome c family protein n=1 Tax=Conexibacter arvalis TaxID=912552 RepID=A0A840IIY5_9ACTN|nr:mono/diheme cytochrome c family protein [Conexibacter arvalis]